MGDAVKAGKKICMQPTFLKWNAICALLVIGGNCTMTCTKAVLDIWLRTLIGDDECVSRPFYRSAEAGKNKKKEYPTWKSIMATFGATL